MRYEFNLPDIGEGLTEAVIQNWLVTEGSIVKEDDPLCEIETDKAIVEVTAPCTGKVIALNGAAGETLQVGTILAIFETDAAPLSNKPSSHDESAPEQKYAPDALLPTSQSKAVPPRTEIIAAPSTRRFARESNIDLSQVVGSGPNGRILHTDVEAQLREAATAQSVASPSNTTTQDFKSMRVVAERGEQRIAIKGLRRAIAEAMVRSATTIPHATSMFRCNGERFLALRKTLQERLGVRVSFTAMVMKAMVPALQKYPYFNSSIDDKSNEIVIPGEINIGFATHTEEGVIVPVVKGVNRISLAEISQEIDRLAIAARERKISLEDMRGGTITLSNVGSHGSAEVTGGQPIINHPQSAIIVMSKIRPQAVVQQGQVIARQCLDIGTSYDHRIIDGIYAAMFMESVINVIEEPGLLIGL